MIEEHQIAYLIDIVDYHRPVSLDRCACGEWFLNRSHAEHVGDVYRMAWWDY